MCTTLVWSNYILCNDIGLMMVSPCPCMRASLYTCGCGFIVCYVCELDAASFRTHIYDNGTAVWFLLQLVNLRKGKQGVKEEKSWRREAKGNCFGSNK